MNMNYKILVLFSITYLFKNIATSTPPTNSSSKYDITKTLRTSIRNIFKNIVEPSTFLSWGVTKKQTISFELEVENKKYAFHSDFDCKLYSVQDGAFNLYCDFIENKVVLTMQSYWVENKGWIKENSNPKHKYPIKQMIYYDNMAFESNGLSLNLSFTNVGDLTDLGEVKNLTEKLIKPLLLGKTRNQLKESISSKIKKMASELHNNSKIIFTSNHPDFLLNEEQHYFLIPNVSLICFDLRNITINGLTNFYSLRKASEPFIYTLLIKNIRGEMILDYGSEIEKPMELNFDAEYLTMSLNSSNSKINLEIGNYRVFQKTENTLLTEHQSMIIIQLIESEIVSSLMPSREVWWKNNQLPRKYNMDSSAGRLLLEMTKNSDFDTKKEILKKWIPFHHKHIMPVPTGRNRTESYQYRVSFRNVTINLISSLSYPEKLLCELPNNLNITREIKAIPIAAISSDNDNDINFKFHVNFPFVSFSNNKSNHSLENDNCQFQLKNNEDVTVNFPPIKNTSEDKESELKKKIDTTLISMAKERIVLNVKPVVCFPYDVCGRTVKTVYDLFSHFIDNVLDKCSLRRIKK